MSREESKTACSDDLALGHQRTYKRGADRTIRAERSFKVAQIRESLKPLVEKIISYSGDCGVFIGNEEKVLRAVSNYTSLVSWRLPPRLRSLKVIYDRYQEGAYKWLNALDNFSSLIRGLVVAEDLAGKGKIRETNIEDDYIPSKVALYNDMMRLDVYKILYSLAPDCVNEDGVFINNKYKAVYESLLSAYSEIVNPLVQEMCEGEVKIQKSPSHHVAVGDHRKWRNRNNSIVREYSRVIAPPLAVMHPKDGADSCFGRLAKKLQPMVEWVELYKELNPKSALSR